MSLAADDQDANGLQLEIFSLNFEVASAWLQKMDINGPPSFVFFLRIEVISSFRCSKTIVHGLSRLTLTLR